MSQLIKSKVAVIGLGYVGLPLAVELGKNSTRSGSIIRPRGWKCSGGLRLASRWYWESLKDRRETPGGDALR